MARTRSQGVYPFATADEMQSVVRLSGKGIAVSLAPYMMHPTYRLGAVQSFDSMIVKIKVLSLLDLVVARFKHTYKAWGIVV
jgi:hypothetical protein